VNTLLHKISLRECRKLSEAEILLRKIPHDNSAGHLDLLLEKINSGLARVLEVNKDGKQIGVCIYEVYKGEFWVLALICSKPVDCFKTIYPIITEYAKVRRCSVICFKTVRPGLIDAALQNSFYVSSVEMRKSL
jgi:hypothetical protein